jgi:hypothetical protein
MQRILSKIISSDNPDRGGVALDLLVAIGIGWIKLSNNALRKILEKSDQALTDPHAKVLVTFMKEHFRT